MLWWRARSFGERANLRMARVATIGFVAASMIVVTQAQALGGVLSIVVSWVAALMGPISVPG